MILTAQVGKVYKWKGYLVKVKGYLKNHPLAEIYEDALHNEYIEVQILKGDVEELVINSNTFKLKAQRVPKLIRVLYEND